MSITATQRTVIEVRDGDGDLAQLTVEQGRFLLEYLSNLSPDTPDVTAEQGLYLDIEGYPQPDRVSLSVTGPIQSDEVWIDFSDRTEFIRSLSQALPPLPETEVQ
jgi:hypothetical protein